MLRSTDSNCTSRYLHIKKADLMGFSNGGTIALQVTIRHPGVVRKLVLASALLKRDMRDFKDIPNEVVRGITAPVLVIIGDADVIRPEHAVEPFALLPSANLAILPGTDHM